MAVELLPFRGSRILLHESFTNWMLPRALMIW